MVAEQKRFAGRMGTMPENISGAVAALGRKEGLEMAVVLDNLSSLTAALRENDADSWSPIRPSV